MSRALEVGYRHIDTAAIYENEEGVGRAVRESGLPRESLFVTTKLWNSAQGYDSALRACDQSLARLGLSQVDLYLIHWPAPAREAYVDSWRALVRLRDEGKVRSIGVSNFREQELRRIIAEVGVVPSVNQIELHPTFTQAPLRAVHAELGIHTQAWSPLARGRILSEPAIVAVARAHGVTPAQAVLRWHLQLGNIVFPKSVTPAHIAANFDLFGFALEAAEMETLSALDRDQRFGGDPGQVD